MTLPIKLNSIQYNLNEEGVTDNIAVKFSSYQDGESLSAIVLITTDEIADLDNAVRADLEAAGRKKLVTALTSNGSDEGSNEAGQEPTDDPEQTDEKA